MGYFIINAVVLGLAALAFQYFWKAILKFCFNLLLGALNITKKVITVVRRSGKAVFYLYRRWKDGRITRLDIGKNLPEGEVIEDPDLLPQGLQDELEIHPEVTVHSGDINPEEF